MGNPGILLLIALAPVVIIAFYIYFRDKYEKEPFWMLVKSLLLGVVIVIPVGFVEIALGHLPNYLPVSFPVFYESFVVAGFTEELFKYAAVLLLIWKNKNFNERFDGIVYATFVSLGFAALENILYVLDKGAGIGIGRAFLSVPGHALFGIFMGYQLGLAKFVPTERPKRLLLAFFIPFICHGIYDYLVLGGNIWEILIFIPLIIYAWIRGFKTLKAGGQYTLTAPLPMTPEVPPEKEGKGNGDIQ